MSEPIQSGLQEAASPTASKNTSTFKKFRILMLHGMSNP